MHIIILLLLISILLLLENLQSLHLQIVGALLLCVRKVLELLQAPEAQQGLLPLCCCLPFPAAVSWNHS